MNEKNFTAMFFYFVEYFTEKRQSATFKMFFLFLVNRFLQEGKTEIEISDLEVTNILAIGNFSNQMKNLKQFSFFIKIQRDGNRKTKYIMNEKLLDKLKTFGLWS